MRIDHLVKNYGSFCAVDDISFEVKQGEIVGLLGPNGAGKSTTMNILTGYLSSTLGSVEINGINILALCKLLELHRICILDVAEVLGRE